MSEKFLRDYQRNAIDNMFTGCILNGGVGSGKSRTALAYYHLKQGGKLDPFKPIGNASIKKAKTTCPKNLYIITTAMKRDKLEWEGEMVPFLLSTKPEDNLYSNKVMVDSWNNIKKYKDVEGAFFIFDEDRVTGNGAWVKAFLKIARVNDWIILSATPGDTWSDYIPVFIANGFYRNKTEFTQQHIVWSRFCKFPKIDRYVNTGRLVRLRNKILVNMDFRRPTVAHHEDIYCDYDPILYKSIFRDKWNVWENKPIETAAETCYALRRIVNTDESRQTAMLEIIEKHPKAIIFYSFDYELEILKAIFSDYPYAEWNGHKHQPIPDTDRWVYFVNYNAGAEGWNSIKTDTVIFFSQNYSYRIMVQASGRIDRLNTPYTDLYYYHIKSRSGIDIAISQALKNKKKFNENGFINGPHI